MAAALQADEFGDVLQVLAENVFVAFGEHRHCLSPKSEQLRSCGWIVQHVPCEEADALFRKKLFRSQTTASPGLGEQDPCVANTFHNEWLNPKISARSPEPINRTARLQTKARPVPRRELR
jgi:hypothetical protein